MNKVTRKKTSKYTTISNGFLRDKNLSLKAKGFLTVVMALPEDWDFSIKGICSVLKEGKTAIYGVVQELKENRYCKTTPNRDEKGLILGLDYVFYEEPYKEEPQQYYPHSENQDMDNMPQLNTNDDKESNRTKNLPNKKVRDKSLTKTANRDSAWRESMEEYLKEVEKAKEELIEDADFKNKFLGMFPNADYLRSIMKSMQYWTSEKAWELKKKSKTKKINMLSTLKNNLDKSIVYKNQQDAPIENLRKLDIEYSDQEEGTLADGTFIKNGYRYYFSYKDKRAYSIPIKAPRMPGEKCEFDMKTNQWYLPRESETMDEWLW